MRRPCLPPGAGGAATPGTIHIRDSKIPDGPQLTATLTAWTAFVGYASHA